ncbi:MULTISPECIES: 3'-5' exonuclease [Streptomyces]|uniref:3'-5' exonuclease n=1 Tax=Streptomyces TaxID=1883 RepID=UPI00163BBFCE|nr:MULTISPECIES: 3'-5' exonuclease [Streptomyces]MBC2877521.1 3'-5' exonuclease [Streptomyces sp. TYQ1024]UBI36237.1 3'-5' exonuclease [Streptomyces mobaraensis]UKW28831.1 3'-5' exonuclease [Streptomyces sp. TYQ1024]
MGWHGELLVGFDLETTGTDPAEARIVTAAVVETKAGEPVGRRSWLADPGVPIPDEAAAIHGITGERAAAEGRPADEVVAEIGRTLAAHWAAGTPVVVYNAAFDLSLLAAELRRYGLPPLLPEGLGPVVDPLTIDRAVDRYRKGRRTLGAVCAEYGVVLDAAHEAGADALAAVRVARAIAERHPGIGEADLADLHRSQVRWYGEWAAGYQAWLRRQGQEGAVVDGRWPLR